MRCWWGVIPYIGASEPSIHLTDGISAQWMGMTNIEDCPSNRRLTASNKIIDKDDELGSLYRNVILLDYSNTHNVFT